MPLYSAFLSSKTSCPEALNSLTFSLLASLRFNLTWNSPSVGFGNTFIMPLSTSELSRLRLLPLLLLSLLLELLFVLLLLLLSLLHHQHHQPPLLLLLLELVLPLVFPFWFVFELLFWFVLPF